MMNNKRTPIEKANAGLNRPALGNHYRFNVDENPLLEEEEARRIEWAKKQKHKKLDKEIEGGIDIEESLSDALDYPNGKKSKKGDRRKRRHLVYEEDSGRVVVKHQRKRQLEHYFDEWDEIP